jgi:hypothetical protein
MDGDTILGKWRTSAPSTPKLDAALAKVQGEMEAASKDATNPHFKKSYADLSSIIAAVQSPCAIHGIARYQPVWTNERGEIVITTRVAHDGEWAEADLIMPVDKKNAQGVGSAITYGKRYGLAAMLGVATTDDDGNDAAGAPPPEPRRSERRTPPGPKDIGPRCSGPKGGHIGEANDRHIRAIHEEGGRPLGDVWTWGIKGAGIDVAKYDGGWPRTAQALTIGDGIKLRDWLKSQTTEPDPPGAP